MGCGGGEVDGLRGQLSMYVRPRSSSSGGGLFLRGAAGGGLLEAI